MYCRWTVLLVATGLLISVVPRCVAQESSGAESTTEKKPQSLDEVLLFFPSKYPAGVWDPKDLRFKDVFFVSKDRTRLHGWYCPCDKPRAVLLLAHGNSGHIASRAPWIRYLQETAKLSVFIFDYRGYGRSEGTPTVAGILQDAEAARAKLRELARIKDSEMLLMGESLGGAVVIQLAADSAPRGLIVQSTFSSLHDVADVHYPQLSWLVPRNKLDSVTQIARYRGPLLLSHGNKDRTIPFPLGKKLYRAANDPQAVRTN
jgi:fermentation-respiration switch protein FrsA (DUF1100 family)